MATGQNLRAVGDRIEQLFDELQTAADPRVFNRAEELLRLVTELYGGGLARIVAILENADPVALEEVRRDDLVASLLLVHGLHSDPLEVRVEAALAKVRPLLGAHGGDVELLGLDADLGAVRLRLLGSCDGCPSSAVTLRMAVEKSIIEAAPEIVVFEVEEPSQASAPGTPIALTVKPAYEECPVELAAT